MTHQQRAKAFLNKVAGEGAVEQIQQSAAPALEAVADPLLAGALLQKAAGPPPTLETISNRLAGSRPEHIHEVTRSAAEKILRNQDLSPSEQFALEAIIIPGQRPAVDIVHDGDFTVAMPMFASFSSDPALKANIQTALRAIGRIEVSGYPGLPYGGTGFLVGRNVLMTNRHVAELFTTGLGARNLAFKPGMGAGVDFHQEVDHRQPETIAVRQVMMIHPFWDMALLQVEGLEGHDPLNLSTELPEAYDGRLVAVVGYPAFDPRNPVDVQNSVFNNIYNVKRLLPGKAGARRDIASFGHTVSAATHDASTLGGNSGSAVLDPQTGAVLGLHFAGLYLDANFFIPASELSRDDRVVRAGTNFAPLAAPDATQTASWWGVTEALVPAPTLAAGHAVTVTVPLQITVSVGAVAPAG